MMKMMRIFSKADSYEEAIPLIAPTSSSEILLPQSDISFKASLWNSGAPVGRIGPRLHSSHQNLSRFFMPYIAPEGSLDRFLPAGKQEKIT